MNDELVVIVSELVETEGSTKVYLNFEVTGKKKEVLDSWIEGLRTLDEDDDPMGFTEGLNRFFFLVVDKGTKETIDSISTFIVNRINDR